MKERYFELYNVPFLFPVHHVDEDRLGETEETISGSEDHELLRRMQKQLLENLHLRGVPGIRKVHYIIQNIFIKYYFKL